MANAPSVGIVMVHVIDYVNFTDPDAMISLYCIIK